MGESTSYSMMGSVLKQSQDREGVRIDAPHGWVINDVHHAWTKNETYHWETGNIFHMTSGQVFHANLNLAEVHTTTNALTMHVDLTPLNVHIGQKLAAFDVHLEPSGLHKQINVHGGLVNHVVNQFEQTAQEVTLTSTSKALNFFEKTVLNHPAHHPGTMTFKADEKMTLQGGASIRLEGGPDNNQAALSLSETTGKALLYSKQGTTVYSSTQTSVLGGNNSSIVLKNGSLELKSGTATVSLSPGKLETNSNNTKLNGTVHIGQPAISGMATVDALQRETNIRKYQDLTNTYDILAIKKALGM